tara:strand:- start:2186 stop:3169 length:984 start_codon:yes stop_codon:yes gene_type:complete
MFQIPDYKYHNKSLKNYRFLITGGAGFIGSHIVSYLLKNNAGFVRVIDNLSNGSLKNINKFSNHKNFEFVEGDINNYDLCKGVIQNIDFVSHQAARGSVPRSISDPISTNLSNVNGFLNIINACKESSQIKNFIYASSSSVYGDSETLLKSEGSEGKPLNPYALSKTINESYAELYYKLYGFKSIGLRYFNVFGPNQNPDSPYAAVIPIFLKSFLNNLSPVINGDGNTIRDFTYVENAVQANIKALLSENINGHVVFNVGCGEKTSLLELINLINEIFSKNIKPVFQDERIGDIKISAADISKIKEKLNYNPKVYIKEGLKITLNSY